MEFGAVFPTTEIGTDPAAIRDWAQAAESLGYARITAYDHVLGADHADREPPLNGPYEPSDAFHEPMVLSASWPRTPAAWSWPPASWCFRSVRPRWWPSRPSEVDMLSGCRLVLGVGTGWNHVEYTSLGTTFRDRAAAWTSRSRCSVPCGAASSSTSTALPPVERAG